MIAVNGTLHLFASEYVTGGYSKESLLKNNMTKYGLSDVGNYCIESNLLGNVGRNTPLEVHPTNVLISPDTLATFVMHGRKSTTPPTPVFIKGDVLMAYHVMRRTMPRLTPKEASQIYKAITLGYPVEKIIAAYRHLDGSDVFQHYTYDLKEVFSDMVVTPLPVKGLSIDLSVAKLKLYA